MGDQSSVIGGEERGPFWPVLALFGTLWHRVWARARRKGGRNKVNVAEAELRESLDDLANAHDVPELRRGEFHEPHSLEVRASRRSALRIGRAVGRFIERPGLESILQLVIGLTV